LIQIRDDLRLAQRQNKMSRKRSETIFSPNPVRREGPEINQEEMLALYMVINTLFPDMQNRILQFIGSDEGVGTSTIVREFARFAAERLGHKVLLVDADQHRAAQSQFYSVNSKFSWIKVLQESGELEHAIHRVCEADLFVSPAYDCNIPTAALSSLPHWERFWASLKVEFDLVLIDSAPLTVSQDALAFASKVDGVVLVVEAERTKQRTARHIRKQIEMVGGKVLGAVFNKSRDYIPPSISRHV